MMQDIRDRWFSYHRERWTTELALALTWTHQCVTTPNFNTLSSNYKNLIVKNLCRVDGRTFEIGSL
jgi:hypothetical protein